MRRIQSIRGIGANVRSDPRNNMY